MKKQITFQAPRSVPPSSPKLQYVFPFLAVDSELVDTPEERARTTQHWFNISISFSLLHSWGVGIFQLEERKSEIERILFEFAKRHLRTLQSAGGRLPEVMELELTTGNSEVECPFDPSRIEAPNGFRFVIDTQQVHSTAPSEHRVLFVSADPKNEGRLRLATEQREIAQKIRLSKYRDNIEFVPCVSTRAPDLSQALLDTDPTIVHFSGHGDSSGAIYLEDVSGNSHEVSAQALTDLFRSFSESIKCVVLNSCYSAAQASAINSQIGHVIGMSDSISDDAALAFSVGFYQAVGAGKSIEVAFNLGLAQISLLGIPEQGIPQLISNRKA